MPSASYSTSSSSWSTGSENAFQVFPSYAIDSCSLPPHIYRFTWHQSEISVASPTLPWLWHESLPLIYICHPYLAPTYTYLTVLTALALGTGEKFPVPLISREELNNWKYSSLSCSFLSLFPFSLPSSLQGHFAMAV
jgi:hypothetical protein